MSSGFMLDRIIMDIFSETSKHEMNSVVIFFSKIEDDDIYLYQVSLRNYTQKKKLLIKKHYVQIISRKKENYGNIWVVCYLQFLIKKI